MGGAAPSPAGECGRETIKWVAIDRIGCRGAACGGDSLWRFGVDVYSTSPKSGTKLRSEEACWLALVGRGETEIPMEPAAFAVRHGHRRAGPGFCW